MIQVLDRYTGSSRPKVITLNLGYLPNADKSLTTETHTTRAALEQALQVSFKAPVHGNVVLARHGSALDIALAYVPG